MKILIIEDAPDIAELIDYNLKAEKYQTTLCKSGAHGLKQARVSNPDLIILDLMLPDMDGLEICRSLKSDPKTKGIPIIILTAKGEEVDRVVGFEVGAEDYISKPFSPRELVLRVKAILRRVRQSDSDKKRQPQSHGILSIDPDKFQVLVGHDEVKLTAIEFKLLSHLMENKGRVATRDKLLDRVWGYDAALTTRTVDTHIKRLRQKLKKAGNYIETIRGIGYRFAE